MPVSSASDRAPGRSRAATRERILASGTALFARRGLHEVTSHDIASEAGVASGTFYLHFPDKQTLFREIVFRAVEELKTSLAAARERAPDRPGARRAQALELLAFAERRGDLVRILFGREGEARGLGADVLDHLAEVARERVAADHAAGVHPDVAAQAVVGMWSRVLAWWLEDPSRARREDVVETLVTFELSVLFVNPPNAS